MRCSRPRCDALTSGPHLVADQVLNVGVAAHITAASPGGARYNPTLRPAQRQAATNGIWLCQSCAKLVDNDARRFPVGLLREWKRNAEAKALAIIGRSSGRRRLSESELAARNVRKRLALRNRLRKLLLKPLLERRYVPGQRRRPPDNFRIRTVLIRSVEDTTYPRIDDQPKGPISGWLKHELWDFYDGGLEVIRRLTRGVVDPSGRWALVNENDLPAVDQAFSPAVLYELGRIPRRNIDTVDPNGDEHYRQPHIYCLFVDHGTPYEDTVYRLQGPTYDWPLYPKDQLDREDVLRPRPRSRRSPRRR